MSDSWDNYLANLEDNFSAKNLFTEKESHHSDHLTEPEDEGELALDIYQTNDKIIICASVAGVSSKNLTVNIHNDVLTIRGERPFPLAKKHLGLTTVYQDCYWGKFSKSIILPETVREDKIQAELRNGLLILELPLPPQKSQTIEIKEINE